MWRLGLKTGLKVSSGAMYQPRRSFAYDARNVVSSPALEQLDALCEPYPPPPRLPSGKVTVLGAGSDVGVIACLFLKQQNVIKTLAMYDELPRRVLGQAHDIAHIDTSVAVEAYQGKPNLKEALDDADVVLVCGGKYPCPPVCWLPDRDLFFYNLQYVRTSAIAVANFCPYAVLCLQTPPLDANFTLAKYTLMKFKQYSPRRLLGLNSINAMRANQLYCNLANQNPLAPTSLVPIVGGCGRCTRVPVFSAMDKYLCQDKQAIQNITRLVREADDLICKVKGNCEQGHLSIGFAAARSVVSVMNGIHKGSGLIDSALVDTMSDGVLGTDLAIISSPVTLGPKGITAVQIPKLLPEEQELLNFSVANLEDMLNLGRCYARGDDYIVHPDLCPKFLPFTPCEPCDSIKVIEGKK